MLSLFITNFEELHKDPVVLFAGLIEVVGTWPEFVARWLDVVTRWPEVVGYCPEVVGI